MFFGTFLLISLAHKYFPIYQILPNFIYPPSRTKYPILQQTGL